MLIVRKCRDRNKLAVLLHQDQKYTDSRAVCAKRVMPLEPLQMLCAIVAATDTYRLSSVCFAIRISQNHWVNLRRIGVVANQIG